MKLYGLSQDQIYKRIKKYAIEKVKICLLYTSRCV